MEEIEYILGDVIVGALQRAVRDAFVAADAHSDREAGADAVRALLLHTLAAALITPKDGALDRSEAAAEKLVAVVKEAVAPRRLI